MSLEESSECLLHGSVAPRRSEGREGREGRAGSGAPSVPSFVLAAEQSLHRCDPAPRAWRANEFPDAQCPPHKEAVTRVLGEEWSNLEIHFCL